jgi:hypothetical protein
METTKLTVRLPKADVDHAKAYARDHGITVTELIDRYFQRLERPTGRGIHPEVEKLAGIVPNGVDARALYAEHVLDKHR